MLNRLQNARFNAIVISFITFFMKSAVARFNYWPNSRFGPDNWENAGYGDPLLSQLTTRYQNTCSDGRAQSPIDLIPNSECVDDHEVHTHRGRHNWDTLSFRVLPHALRVIFPSFSEADEEKPKADVTWPPSADFSNLAEREAAVYMDVKIPAEHSIDGQQYPGEVHIAHAFSNTIVYLAIFIDFEQDKYHDQFEQFLREWEEIKEERDVQCFNSMNPQAKRRKYRRAHPVLNATEMEDVWGSDGNRADFDLYQMLPTVYYFGYKGSFTVPPCTEDIFWRVLDIPMQISRNQYERLQSVLLDQKRYDCSDNRAPYEGGVNRPIQSNKNDVWHCSGNYWKPKDPERWCNEWPTNYHGYHRLQRQDECS